MGALRGDAGAGETEMGGYQDYVQCLNSIKPLVLQFCQSLPQWVKNLAANAGDTGSISGGGNGNPFGILAWRIPWTKEPGGLHSMGSQSQTRLKRVSTHPLKSVLLLVGEERASAPHSWGPRLTSFCCHEFVTFKVSLPAKPRGGLQRTTRWRFSRVMILQVFVSFHISLAKVQSLTAEPEERGLA